MKTLTLVLGMICAVLSLFFPQPVQAQEQTILSSRYPLGDANGDQQVNIADPIYILFYVMLGGPPPLCIGSVNLDGSMDATTKEHTLDITDAILLLDYLFQDKPFTVTPSDCRFAVMDSTPPSQLKCPSYVNAQLTVSSQDGPIPGEENTIITAILTNLKKAIASRL